MPKTCKPKPDDPAQYQRFLDIAKEVGADEDEGALDRAFERVETGIKTIPAGKKRRSDEKP